MMLTALTQRILTGRYTPALLEAAALAAILALYFNVATQELGLPGIHPDEAQEVIPAMQLLRGQSVETLRGGGLTLFGRRFPLMIVDYIGTVNTYLALPFLALFGVRVTTLRLMAVLTSGVTLVLLYRLGRAMYGPVVGLLAAALLALQPTFIYWSRQGAFVTFVTAPLTLAAIWLGWRWWRGGRSRDLYSGALLLGLALAAKLLTLWVIVGVGGAFVILYGRQIWGAIRLRSVAPLGLTLTWRQFAVSVVFFALGATMLIIHNLQTGGTWLTIRDNLRTSYYGVNNLALLGNLAERFVGLKVILTGEHFWYLGGVAENPYWPWVLGVVGIAALGFTLWREPGGWRALIFPFLALALMTAVSIFTVSALWFTHFALIVPWPPLALAVALVTLARQLDDFGAPRWYALGLVAFVTVALMLMDLRVDRAYQTALHNTWGYGAHSGASYDLVKRLREIDDPAPYALDWGIQDPVQFLSKGDINPVEITGFEFEPGPDFARRVAESLDDPDPLYILHSPQETVFPRRDAFVEALASQGMTLRQEEVIYDIGGRPVFMLLWVQPSE